jgi:hydrogenase nickel incorporation protein HypA/HybF
MHEMSIALGVVDIARKALAEAEADHIESITLEIGALAGVQMDALTFVWPAAVAESPLEGAERIIEQPPGMALCLECHTTFPLSKHYDACTNCGGYFKEIISGKELNVKSMVFTKLGSKIQ